MQPKHLTFFWAKTDHLVLLGTIGAFALVARGCAVLDELAALIMIVLVVLVYW